MSLAKLGHRLEIRPDRITASDGVREARLFDLNAAAKGVLDPESPSVLRYADGFGPGRDLEICAREGELHIDVIIPGPVELPPGFDPDETSLRLYLELNLDDLLSGGEAVLACGSKAIDSIPSLGDQLATATETIGLVRRPGGADEEPRVLWALVDSTVSDSLSPQPRCCGPLAKAVGRHADDGKTYLVEVLPFKFVQETTAFPLRWDPIPVTGNIWDDVWESGETYHVTGNIYVFGTLTIEPAVTVKVNPSRYIAVLSLYGYSGAIVARGRPWEFITFTSASDAYCGEEIPGAPTGKPSKLLILGAGSRQESVIQYCKFANCYGQGGMLAVYPDLYEPIAHNVFCLPGGGYYFDYCCVYVCGSSLDDLVLSNNLFVCNQHALDTGLYYHPTWTSGTSRCSNNTFVGFASGVYAANCGPNTSIEIFDSLFSQSTYGVIAPHSTIHHNAFHLTPPCGNPYIDLGQESPFATCKLGDYYLAANWIPELAGSRSAAEAGFTPDIFTVKVPPETQEQTIGEIYRMTLYPAGTEIVRIGYHAPRVDQVVSLRVISNKPACEGVTGSCYDIEAGCVVAFVRDLPAPPPTQGSQLYVFGTRLICKGLGPAAGPLEAWNRLVDSRCAVTVSGGKTMSPWYRADLNGLAFGCNQGYNIEFTEFAWLGAGIAAWNSQETVVPSGPCVGRGNVFKFCRVGMVFAQSYAEHLVFEPEHPLLHFYRARNCLFYKNLRGMHGTVEYYDPATGGPPFMMADFCTFDQNQQGIYTDEVSHAKATNCLFTRNGEIVKDAGLERGAFILNTNATDELNEEDFNAFFGNVRDTTYADDREPVPPEQAVDSFRGRHSIVLSESPYDRLSNERSVWFLTQQAGNQALDATDKDAVTSNLVELFGYSSGTTSRNGFHENAGIDVGYHLANIPDSDGDGMPDPWEQCFGLNPQSGDAGLDPDCDTYTNLTEYSERTPNGPVVGDFERGPYLEDLSDSQVTIFWATRQSFTDHRIEYYKEGESPWSHTVPVPDGVGYARGGELFEVQEKTVTGLEGAKKYFYRVKSKNGGSDVVGAGHSFWTLARTGWSWPFRIVFHGDHEGSGSSYQKGHRRTAHSLLSGHFSAYDRKQLLLFDGGDYTELGGDEVQWSSHYFAPGSDLFHQIPASGVPGEKEHSQIQCYRNYFAPAPMPIRWSREYFYDEAGNSCLYVLFIDTEDLDPDDQAAIEQELSSVSQRNPKPWIVVVAHIPCVTHTSPYSIWDDDVERVRAAVAKIFFDNGVDIVLSSHSHVYERYRYRSTGDPSDVYLSQNFHDSSFPTYLVAGGGGAAFHDLLNLSDWQYGVGHYARDFPPQSDMGEGAGNSLGETLHHCVIEFVSATEARLSVREVTGLLMGENEKTRDVTVTPEESILIQKRAGP